MHTAKIPPRKIYINNKRKTPTVKTQPSDHFYHSLILEQIVLTEQCVSDCLYVVLAGPSTLASYFCQKSEERIEQSHISFYSLHFCLKIVHALIFFFLNSGTGLSFNCSALLRLGAIHNSRKEQFLNEDLACFLVRTSLPTEPNSRRDELAGREHTVEV